MPRYNCTYTGITYEGEEPLACTFSIISEGPCSKNASAPPAMSCVSPVLTGSEEIPEPESTTGKKVAGPVVGGGAGAGAVMAGLALAGAGPIGWAIGLGVAVGAGLGWLASS